VLSALFSVNACTCTWNFHSKKHDISLFKVWHGVRFCEKCLSAIVFQLRSRLNDLWEQLDQDSLLCTCLSVIASSYFVKECRIFVNPPSVLKGKQWHNCFLFDMWKLVFFQCKCAASLCQEEVIWWYGLKNCVVLKPGKSQFFITTRNYYCCQ